jgi:hypothetical protein
MKILTDFFLIFLSFALNTWNEFYRGKVKKKEKYKETQFEPLKIIFQFLKYLIKINN